MAAGSRLGALLSPQPSRGEEAGVAHPPPTAHPTHRENRNSWEGGGQRTDRGQTETRSSEPQPTTHTPRRSDLVQCAGSSATTSDHLPPDRGRLRTCHRGQRPKAATQENLQDPQLAQEGGTQRPTPANTPGWLDRNEATPSCEAERPPRRKDAPRWCSGQQLVLQYALGLAVPFCSLVPAEQCPHTRPGAEEEHPDLSWWPDMFSTVVLRAPAHASLRSQPRWEWTPCRNPYSTGSSGRCRAHGTMHSPPRAQKANAERKPTRPVIKSKAHHYLC